METALHSNVAFKWKVIALTGSAEIFRTFEQHFVLDK